MTGGERLAGGRIARDDLTRVDAGADGELDAEVVAKLRVQVGEHGAHLRGRTHRAQCVVLVDVGMPKTAITASPMNFSTVPPCRSSDGA